MLVINRNNEEGDGRYHEDGNFMVCPFNPQHPLQSAWIKSRREEWVLDHHYVESVVRWFKEEFFRQRRARREEGRPLFSEVSIDLELADIFEDYIRRHPREFQKGLTRAQWTFYGLPIIIESHRKFLENPSLTKCRMTA